MPTEEFLGLLDRRTGRPVQVRGAGRKSGGIGGDGFDLVDAGGQDYRADDADDLVAVLAEKVPSYNQTPQRPGLGAYDAADLVPARIRVSMTWEQVDLESERTPFFGRSLERRVPPVVAFGYVPGLGEHVGRQGSLTLVVGTPKDADRDPLDLVGKVVGTGYEDYPTRRTVLAAVPVPEEVADAPDGVLLVCKEDDTPTTARPADLRAVSAAAWDARAASPRP